MSTIFVGAGINKMTLSELAEARARAGFCPSCSCKGLKIIGNEAGMLFRGCNHCGAVVVLSSGETK